MKISKSSRVQRITESALLLAIATAVSWVCQYVPFLNFPFGGGITIASMLPILLISYRFGVRWGLFSGFCYALIQMLLGHNTVAAIFTPGSDSYTGIRQAVLICLFDYLLAYTAIGLGGMFRNRNWKKEKILALGCIVALSTRYLCHILSGYIFYGAWAEWFFTQEGIYELVGKSILENVGQSGLVWIYTVVYNGAYMIPEILITTAASLLIVRLPFVKKAEIR